MSKKYALATFRIVSESLSPHRITEALKAQPTITQVKGDPRPVGKRKPYEVNSWILHSSVGERADVGDHLRELAEFVTSNAQALNRLIESSDARLDMFLTFGDQSRYFNLVLDGQLISNLALVPLQVSLTWNTIGITGDEIEED